MTTNGTAGASTTDNSTGAAAGMGTVMVITGTAGTPGGLVTSQRQQLGEDGQGHG